MVLIDSRNTSGIKLPIRNMTHDEFYFFCQENPDFKFERDANGKIITMALTGGITGRRNTDITTDLTLWNRSAKLGVVFDSSTGFALPNGADRSPDAAFVVLERWNQLTPDQQSKLPPLCPDFVVELMSENDSLREATAKMHEYMENGCQLGWLITPKTEEARLFRPDGSVRVVHGFDATLDGEDILPGFTFDLRLLK